jgi:hypothetical protein
MQIARRRPSKGLRTTLKISDAHAVRPRRRREMGGEEIPKKELATAADQLKVYAGGYWCDELGVFYRLSLIEGKIRVIS